jgi:hypothetical protein
MSHRKNGMAISAVTPKAKCELCGASAELRPYGPRGENICFQCGMNDKPQTERQMSRVLFNETVQ